MYVLQVCTEDKTILSVDDIVSLIGPKCDGVIGQVHTPVFYSFACQFPVRWNANFPFSPPEFTCYLNS